MKHSVIIGTDGIPCPRCGKPTEIRAHAVIRQRQLSQPYYYSQWYNCAAADCATTLIMRDEFKVYTDKAAGDAADRLKMVREQLTPRGDLANGRPPLPDQTPPWD